MAQLKHSNKPLFTINVAANIRVTIFALASIVLMMMDHRTQQLDTVRDTLATLVYPMQYAVQLPFDAANRLYNSLALHRELQEENERLRKKQLFINAQLQKLNSLEAENRRLRMLLESSGDIREQVLIAELLAVDSDPYRHQILINKGNRHGVHTGQPLIDQQGVAGQIIHASAFTSTAILITDPNHALPVQVDRNGLSTLAIGTGNLQQLELDWKILSPKKYKYRQSQKLLTYLLGLWLG